MSSIFETSNTIPSSYGSLFFQQKINMDIFKQIYDRLNTENEIGKLYKWLLDSDINSGNVNWENYKRFDDILDDSELVEMIRGNDRVAPVFDTMLYNCHNKILRADFNIDFPDPIVTTRLVGSSYPGNTKWWGGVLHPNGRIYGIPYETARVLEIDPRDTDNITTRLVGSSYSGNKWRGGTLYSNGRIYAAGNQNQLLEIDPHDSDNIITRLVGSSYSGDFKWYSLVRYPTGRIYAIPGYHSQVLEIDPRDPDNVTTRLVGDSYSGDEKWMGGVLHPNGRIYGIPHSHTQVLEIDPRDPDNVTTRLVGSSYSGTDKWYGGTLHSNGRIYCPPSSHAQYLEINPIDPTNITLRFVGNVYSGDNKSCYAALHFNGKLYTIPRNMTQVLECSISQNFKNFDVLLSPYYNKF